MSLFTKRRKQNRIAKEEHNKKLNDGFDKIEASLKRQIRIAEAIEKDHPEYEDLSEEERIKIYKEYCDKIWD